MIRNPSTLSAAAALLTGLLAAQALAAPPDVPNPVPRPVVLGEVIRRWDFDDSVDGWRAAHDCRLAAADNSLVVTATGTDPYFSAAVDAPAGDLVLRARMKSDGGGVGQFFWSNRGPGAFSAERNRTFRMIHDGQWHDYQVLIRADLPLQGLRLDPGLVPGTVQVDWIEVRKGGLHPLEIKALESDKKALIARIHNHGETPSMANVNGSPITLPPGETTPATLPLAPGEPIEYVTVALHAEGLPPVIRGAWIWRPDAPLSAVRAEGGDMAVDIARDGSVVRLIRAGKVVGALAPLVHRDGERPELKLDRQQWPFRFSGDGMTVTLDRTADNELRVRVESEQPVEGPVVRVLGDLEQGLLAGVEYLGKAEQSSSKLDIETSEHLRVEPDPMKLTMPLMACVTDRASVALTWDDMTLQPVFAVPNFLDGTPDHRMSLKGTSIGAVLRVGPGWNADGRLEEAILWATKRRGLPDLPPRPRSLADQMELSRAAYRGLMFDSETGGWFHAVVPGVRRSPSRGVFLADHVSSLWRITGSVRYVPSLAPGGSHVRNPASYFVMGRAADWLQFVNRRAETRIRQQRPDGSYRYGGKYRRGHFEDTASGFCARSAYELLEHAYYTGNGESLKAGLRTLEFMKRFRTPRGNQVWEVPLHTPDIMASAHAVWAYVRAYELSGDKQWLDEARRWATTGLPFVYQWSNRPIMAYATTPVFGATNWRAPNWIGLPVQWCGTVYAYALLLLDPHDDTVDWRKVAEGILICAEQMQYIEGPSIGCLPDVFELPSQTRRPADINPSAVVSLRLLIEGKLDALDRATDGNHVIVAPYPVKIREGRALVQAEAGVKYQVLIDGERLVDVESKGEDIVDLQ
jgi:hypothetical protein